ncbi:MAG: amino acid racemase [Aliivibrio sp.]|uniref:aspartate/glutamate racemase family protein n=1 Tax=Aliivibrio sp. TaxID=1872443 RepID=UPI001A3EA34C|nr:amino acid racemase [Aliivibrio sp.]
MKKFGLIGGTSWHSTIDYYSLINEMTNKNFKNNSNPPLRLVNLNQKQIHDCQRRDDWDSIANILTGAALELQSLQVEGIAFCANTPHRVYKQVQEQIDVPILHIADSVGEFCQKQKIQKLGLLGTVFTMEHGFIKDILLEKYDVTCLIPQKTERQEIQRILYDELSMGNFSTEARQYFLEIIKKLADKGTQSIMLGCTEFPILLRDSSTPCPMINSTQCHANAIVNFILNKDVIIEEFEQ